MQVSSTLDLWLVDELVRRYAVPRRAAHRLIYDRQIIFCFDGLDELKPGVDDSGEAATRRRPLNFHRVRRYDQQHARRSIRSDHPLLPQSDVSGIAAQTAPRLSPCGPAAYRGRRRRFLAGWANLDGLRDAMAESARLREKASAPCSCG